MPKICVLSDILASQVAAGEVVERPASVVKELVENSLDAGAGEIRVDMDQGGAALIRVSDDGCGMSREDALLSLERHATSKLRTSADLTAIRTLGFRGEAVPSIASVSRFRMVTREASALAGTEILVDGGKIRNVRDAGCAPGTLIEAKALFFNMPARRKFLRAESTEAAHVEHQLRLHALASPHVRFRLRRDDREIFDLPPAAQAFDRVRQLLGTDLAGELIPLPLIHGHGITVEGFVLPPLHARKGRRHQCVFLNGRPVEDAVISRALTEAFRGTIAEGLHPAAWLWMHLDPTLVDVNVHPAKREVRFHKPFDVRDAILEAVRLGLHPPGPPPRPNSPATPPVATGFRVPQAALPTRTDEPLSTPIGWLKPALYSPTTPTENEDAPPLGGLKPALPAPLSPVPEFRILGLLLHRFVVMESHDGLVLFDPKAAKERIFYDSLILPQHGTQESQGLLVPILLELDPRDLDLLLRERLALSNAGIDIEPFGGNTLQIRALPACLGIEAPRAFLSELLDELLHDPATGASRFAPERLARMLAKRAASLIDPKLSETLPLLADLFSCQLPYCAPDGRPTLTEFSLRELERRLGSNKN
jgi:DNA mismatch repair protein MutL